MNLVEFPVNGSPRATAADAELSRCWDLEARLLRIEGVHDAVVVRRRAESGAVLNVAYICCEDAALRSPLAEIDRSVRVTAIPLDAQGGIDWEALLSIPVLEEAMLGQYRRNLASSGYAVDVSEQKVPREKGSVDCTRILVPPSMKARAESVAAHLPSISGSLSVGPFPDRPLHLVEVIERAISKDKANGIQFICNGRRDVLSFRSLYDSARRIAGGLYAAGAVPGESILLICREQRQFLEGFWGAVLAGLVPIPAAAPLRHTEEDSGIVRMRNVLKLFEKPWLLLGDEDAAPITELLVSTPGPRPLALSAMADAEPLQHRVTPDPDAPAIMLLTSGSTGVPKAVVQTHRHLIHQVVTLSEDLGLGADDVSLNWFPLDHVCGIVMFHLRDLQLGCTQIHTTPEEVLGSPLSWLDWMQEFGVTVGWAPNFAFGLVNAGLRQHPERQWNLSALRILINAGEAITHATAASFVKSLHPHGLRLDVMRPAWGMSETCSIVTCAVLDPFNAPDDGFVALGAPVRGLQMRIVDGDNLILPAGSVGRLQIRGATVTDFYYQNEQANAESFTEDGWFITGDLGKLNNGELAITGRTKDVIIVNGLNLYCHELEAVVERVEGVSPSFAAAVAIRSGDSEAIAIFIHTDYAEGAWPELMTRVRAALLEAFGVMPRYVLPVTQSHFSKTGIGKLQRQPFVNALATGEFDALIERTRQKNTQSDRVPDSFYRKNWVPRKLSSSVTKTVDACLLFLDAEGMTLDAIGSANVAVTVVPGAEFARLSPSRFRLNPASADDYVRLLEALQEEGTLPKRIVHAWSYGARGLGSSIVEVAGTAQANGFDSMVHLIRAWPELYACRIFVVSSDVQRLDRDIAWERSPLRALVNTVSAERPWVTFRHIDFRSGDGADHASLLREELQCEPNAHAEISYAGGVRHVPALERLSWSEQSLSSQPFVRGGCYVVTGGFGGAGSHLVAHLQEQYQATLLVLGRTSLGEADERSLALQKSILSAQQRPGTIQYVSVDLGDTAALSAVLTQFEVEHGDISGVLHLAGCYATAPLAPTSDALVHEVMRAKVTGSCNLEQHFANRPDVFFVHMSSAVTQRRGLDNSAYAAANSFVESFSQYQRGHRRSWCIAWSFWHETGMSKLLASTVLLERQGFMAIAPQHAVGALQLLLALPCADFLVGMDPDHAAVSCRIPSKFDVVTAVRIVTGGGSGEHASAVPPVLDEFGIPSGYWLEHRTSDAFDDQGRLLAHPPGWQTKPLERPTTQTEKRMADIWSAVLGVSDIGRHDNFFELGGSSLSAAELMVAVDKAFRKRFTFAMIVTRPTVAGLSAEIDVEKGTARPAPPCLVPLQQKGDSPAFFGAHPLFGLVYPYAQLARHMGADRPFYALQARGYIPGAKPHATLEEMAKDYIIALKEVQPHGPYYLGGWSYGSLIAMEMAKQLQDAGESIAALVIIDQATDSVERFFDEMPVRTQLQRFFQVVGNAMRGYDPYYVQNPGLWNALRRPLKLAGFVTRVFTPMVKVGIACTRMARTYRLPQYCGDIVLLHTGDPEFTRIQDERLGWDRFVTGQVHVHRIPGNHLTLHEAPHVIELAAKLKKALAECDLRQKTASNSP